MSKPEPPKKSPRRPSLELQTMHKIDVLLCELSEAESDRVLDWLISRRDLRESIRKLPPSEGD